MTLWTRVRGLVTESDPSARLVARSYASAECPTARVACIYRAVNVENVLKIIDSCHGLDVSIGLWALDEIHPRLARLTLAQGPGTRFHLVNSILAQMPTAEYDVVIDDDVIFVQNDLALLLKLVRDLALDIAMPSHARASPHGHALTRQRPFSVARVTTFVDIGPVLVIGPKWRSRVEPFPEEGMGWGVELEWYDLHLHGLRMGVVDAVSIRHLAGIGGEYAVAGERLAAADGLRKRGFRAWSDVEAVIFTHRPWSSRASRR
jgi:hypothetical protein